MCQVANFFLCFRPLNKLNKNYILKRTKITRGNMKRSIQSHLCASNFIATNRGYGLKEPFFGQFISAVC